MARLRFTVAGLMGLVLAVAIAFGSLRFASEPWAGVVLLLTLGVLSTAILGIVYRSGAGRAAWLGFALLGWGYMALTAGTWWDRGTNRPELITTTILDRLYQYFQPDTGPWWPGLERMLGVSDPRSRQILSKLDQPIPIQFPDKTPLEDVLKYIRAATQGPNDNGIPIYIDPVGLQEAKKTMQSLVILDLEGMPLRTTLALMLKQLGLRYEVRDGLLRITSGMAVDAGDAFRRIGHCYWALLAACIGSMAGRFFYATRPQTPGLSR